MATDYSKKTNADLVEILKSRSLPHTGKKADLVARLQEDDAKNAGTTAAPAPAAKADVADDVIDWEDDEPTEGAAAATAPKASTEAGAATIEAGGKGQASNPAAVPNQKLDENPAATSDLKIEATGETAQAGGAEAAPAEGAGGDDQTAGKSDAAYAKGLPITEMEEELKKRKARAEKFGVTEESQAAITNAEKQLDRAKRFGTGVAPRLGSRNSTRHSRKKSRASEARTTTTQEDAAASVVTLGAGTVPVNRAATVTGEMGGTTATPVAAATGSRRSSPSRSGLPWRPERSGSQQHRPLLDLLPLTLLSVSFSTSIFH